MSVGRIVNVEELDGDEEWVMIDDDGMLDTGFHNLVVDSKTGGVYQKNPACTNNDDSYEFFLLSCAKHELKDNMKDEISQEAIAKADNKEIAKHEATNSWRTSTAEEILEWKNAGHKPLVMVLVRKIKKPNTGEKECRSRLVLLANVLKKQHDGNSFSDAGATPSYQNILTLNNTSEGRECR